MDHDQDQVRGHGDLQQGRYPRRSDLVDEGNRRGAVAAQDRNCRRGRSSDTRQVPDGRQSDQTVGLDLRGEALAAAWRAHRRDPEGRAQALGKRHCGDQELRRSQRAEEGRKGSVDRSFPQQRGPRHQKRWMPVFAGMSGRGGVKCVSSFTASRPSARLCWKRCSSAGITSSRSTWRRKKKAPKPIHSRKPQLLPSSRSINRPPTRTQKSGKSSRPSSPTCRSWPSSRCLYRKIFSISRRTDRSSITPRCCLHTAAPVPSTGRSSRERKRPSFLFSRPTSAQIPSTFSCKIRRRFPVPTPLAPFISTVSFRWASRPCSKASTW